MNPLLRRALTLIVALVATLSLQAKVYVVAVGISHYKSINDLRLPENDAKTIAAIFKTHTRNVMTITGRYATKANITKALRDQLARAKRGDQVIFFFSGHGYDDGFCPYDMQRNGRGGLSYSEIGVLFRNCKASSKIILADACHSGGLRKTSQRPTTPKPGSNVMLFLSCRTKEVSIEHPSMTNGFFTTYLEQGLRGAADANRDRNITALELYNYVSKGVKNISRDKQHPVMWGKFKDSMSILRW